MTDPSPNYKILHIEPCRPQAASSSSSSGADMSVLQFQIFHFLRRCIPMEIRHLYGDHDVPRLNRITNPVKEIKTSVLLQGNSDQGAARDMSRTLSSLEIPENSHAEIIQSISQVARQQQQQQQQYLTTMESVNLQVKIGGITTESESAYHEIIRMVNEVIPEAEEEEEEMLETVPASRSCIEALKKVRLGGMEEEVKQRCQCSICLNEFRVGLEVIRLPCLHAYHPDCIVKWLETSHMCPLCRHPMPLDQLLHDS
ncbi:hypothetical protein Dsin_006295 [Dipteronia sinensis]|uniref:RING-type E3 ubiquitin transferase n=1 Tax=Dipteronia sinensis TaxID=43782 RepID=A0AAE0EFF5_9ROSI|nr:hypothetical protein Dsin_006295 [Dipteronia sinensis]